MKNVVIFSIIFISMLFTLNGTLCSCFHLFSSFSETLHLLFIDLLVHFYLLMLFANTALVV